MALMIDHAFEAAQTVEGSFAGTPHRRRQWEALIEAVIPRGDKLLKLVNSLRRDPQRDTRDQFIDRMNLISELMPENGRALFVLDPEKYMPTDSDQAWALVVRRLPDKIKLIAGCTGVQAPLLYPYIPEQLRGLLGAIKGAAEYEQLVQDKYGGEDPPLRYLKGKLRMGPQLIAHVLIILLIVVANLIFFAGRKWEGAK